MDKLVLKQKEEGGQKGEGEQRGGGSGEELVLLSEMHSEQRLGFDLNSHVDRSGLLISKTMKFSFYHTQVCTGKALRVFK